MKVVKITESNISELTEILEKLNCKNLHLYWTILEQKDKNLINTMQRTINEVLEYYRKQIARMYVLNIIEQELLQTKDTELNKILDNLKFNVSNNGVLDRSVIYGLHLHNIKSIFTDEESNPEYNLICEDSLNQKIKDNNFILDAINYTNSLSNKEKTKKKILNII